MTLPPDELRSRRQWVTWKRENGTKVPYNAQRPTKKASTIDPATWSTYEQACAAAARCHHAGVGYVFSSDDPYAGVDLDDCVVEGQLSPEASAIVAQLDTYTEISPSGTGVKMWVIGDIPSGATSKEIEIYSQARFFTFTGQQLPGTPSTIRDAQTELMALYDRVKPKQAPRPESAGAVPRAASDADYIRRWCLAALDGEHQMMLDADDGERHNRRIRSAYALGGLVPSGGLTEDEITCALAVNFGHNQRNAMKTIADGIKAGRERPRTIPAPKLRTSVLYTIDESTPEGAKSEIERLRRENAQLRASVDRLEGWRDWAMTLASIRTEKLSPAAKVVAFTLWPEMQSRKERGIEEPQEIYIGDEKKPGAADKAGVSPGTYGAKLKELDSVGAFVRVKDRRANGNRRILIQTTAAFWIPEAWAPPAPRNHGGYHPKEERPAPECPDPECTPATPFREEVSTMARLVCWTHGEFHVTEERLTSRTWQIDAKTGTWKPTKFRPLRPAKDPNTQIAQYKEDGGSPPITQIAGWVDDASEAPNNHVEHRPSSRPVTILQAKYEGLARARTRAAPL